MVCASFYLAFALMPVLRLSLLHWCWVPVLLGLGHFLLRPPAGASRKEIAQGIGALLFSALAALCVFVVVVAKSPEGKAAHARRVLEADRADPSRWRLRQIIEETTPLATASKARRLEPNSPEIVIRGKVVLAYVADNAFVLKPGLFGLPAPDEKQATVFMFGNRRDQIVGQYEVTGRNAIRVYQDVHIAYWPQKQALGTVTLVIEPPKERHVKEFRDSTGDLDGEITAWLQGLPRIE
jgi:hypothetical protein